ncbi:uncharacterized protein LOC126833116 [Adelges cooleyi]|uniref:uncharacterized protein LOC126833116 n=1 Tax=Adelges cooleyi TaxID=133065 RepID=UPI00217FF73A|nr:uncharacterized protein LOC126833116 [Adelges cooleyi]
MIIYSLGVMTVNTVHLLPGLLGRLAVVSTQSVSAVYGRGQPKSGSGELFSRHFVCRSRHSAPSRLRDHKIIFPRYIDDSCVCKPKINTPTLKQKIVTASSYIVSSMVIYCGLKVLAKTGVWGSQDETRPILDGLYDALGPIFCSKKEVKTRKLTDRWNDFLWKIGSFICGNVRTEPTKIQVTDDVSKLSSHEGLPTIPYKPEI